MTNMLTSVGVSLAIGIFLAIIYGFKNKCTKSFLTMIVMLPAVVCMVILMVNGSVGTGLAVAGAFSLVRFRSVPGNAKDIGTIFLAMACGLITAMGEYEIAAAFAVMMGVVLFAMQMLPIKTEKENARVLKITIPEDLNYGEVFEDIFDEYLKNCETTSVKTSNMGSLYKLTYLVEMKDPKKEQEFMNDIRCRNGNLEVGMSRQEESYVTL